MKFCSAPALVIFILIVPAACSDPRNVADIASSTPAPNATLHLGKEGCVPLSTDYSSPQVGTGFEYSYQNGMRVVRTIKAVDGRRVDYSLRVVRTPDGGSPAESKAEFERVTLGSMFPLTQHVDRSTIYDEDPFDALLTMAVGDRKVINGADSLSTARRTEVVPTKTEIEYLGCGEATLASGPRFLRAYKVTTQGVSSPRGREPELKTATTIYYVDPSLGMPARIQGLSIADLVFVHRARIK